MNKRTVFFAALAFLALLIFSRSLQIFFDVPYNLSTLGAVALFGGAYLGHSWKTLLSVLGGIWISDVLVNFQYFETLTLFYPGYGFTLVAYLATITIGHKTLNNPANNAHLLGATLLSAVAFFLITNFGSWWVGPQYTKDFTGLLSSYTAGLPFFRGTLAGNVLFGFAFFKSYQWLIGKRDFALEPIK
jgi:hypothetical protein